MPSVNDLVAFLFNTGGVLYSNPHPGIKLEE